MAITQISQITNRKGLQIDLPAKLAAAELGWCLDTRRLFIGNGDLVEGAPVVGNTEVVTEFSDIIKPITSYTYEGKAAGYIAQTGVTPGTPVTMSLQDWMDQWVSVKDFGATGNGFTDDTDAINRALYQIYCVDNNPQVRKAIFFPAGVYRTSAPIKVPPYATLYGEGAENSIIQLDRYANAGYVMVTADSDQQTGVAIGANGATLPRSITISDMSLASLDNTASICLLDSLNIGRFFRVSFKGALNDIPDLSTDSFNSAGIRFNSTAASVTNSIVFDTCEFSQLTWAVTSLSATNNTNSAIKGVTITNSKLYNLYQGIVLGNITPTSNSPTGFRITNNVFNSIYAQAIYMGMVELNASAYNIFYDVGNYFLDDLNPYTAIIEILNNNNLSIGDLFSRPESASGIIDPGVSYPRIVLNDSTAIAFNNSESVNIGSYIRQSGQSTVILDDRPTPTTVMLLSGVPYTISTLLTPFFTLTYSIDRGGLYRTGVITAASIGTGQLSWSDDYSENEPTGIKLALNQINDIITISYTSTLMDIDAVFKFSVQTFSYSVV